ncbi:MAG: FAD-dependent monooxygenase, partial [Myxococcales bacterium]|nr:FAD-dependent monooxygenase [Myxococcales bacterium]
MQLSRLGERAVVVGGGIAGLAAAGVLARRFDQVDLLERDHYEAEPSVRPHAPQGSHAHILLAGGLLALTRLVPALPAWLDELGLPEGDLTEHVRVAFAGRWLPKVRSGVPVRSCTRPQLEHLLLRDVRSRDNIRVNCGCKVLGLDQGRRGSRVSYEHAGQQHTVEAPLIVDASGRGSLIGRWLRARGTATQETAVDAGVLYTSCTFELPAQVADDWKLLGVMPQMPHDPYSAALMRVGHDRILCAMICYGRPKAPNTPAEMVERTRLLSVAELYQVLQAARP